MCRLSGYNSKWHFAGLPIRHTVMSWVFRRKAVFLWMPVNTGIQTGMLMKTLEYPEYCLIF